LNVATNIKMKTGGVIQYTAFVLIISFLNVPC